MQRRRLLALGVAAGFFGTPAAPAAARVDADCKELAPEGSAASSGRDADDHRVCVVERGTERGALRIFRDDAEVYTALVRPCRSQNSKRAFSAIYQPLPDDSFIAAGVLPVGASAVEVSFAKGESTTLEAAAVSPNSRHPVFAGELEQLPIGFEPVGAVAAADLLGGCPPAFDTRVTDDAFQIFTDELYGFSTPVPTSWEVSTSPSDLFSALTRDMVPTVCGASTPAAQVGVYENRISSAPEGATARSTFGPSSGRVDSTSGQISTGGCNATIKQTSQLIAFREGGRTFQASVHIAPQATDEQSDQAYTILNSMRILPEDELRLGRPAGDVRVYVLNGSGHPTATNSIEDGLTHLGYQVVGSRRASSRARTVVACRQRFEDNAGPLARALGLGTRDFPGSAPRGIKNAACIVHLGKDASFEVESAVQEVTVSVLNGSGVTKAAEVTANVLRGLGYPIAGIGDAPQQDGSTVACRGDHDDDAAVLVDTLRSMELEIEIASFPNPAPASTESALCIVTLGTEE